MSGQLRAVSYGGGVQSTALLALAAQGRIDYPLFLFANVGDDSEHPGTLAYIDKHAKPYAAQHGIELVELRRRKRDGTEETLWQRLMREESRSVPIPVRMDNGAPGTRNCTADFKLKVIAKELRRRGANASNPATVAVGISTDESTRANRRHSAPNERIVYPLLDLGLRRTDCTRIIRDAGLPVPPKSSCFFCPFHRPSTWQDMRRDEPELFEKSAQLEEVLNRRRAKLGKDRVYLTRFAAPLRDVIPDGADLLPFADEADYQCDNGACWT